MKKLIVLLFVLSFISLIAKEYKGQGEAFLGNGVTMEKVEEIAEVLAQRDAVSQFGVHISSETVLKNYELESDEIKAVATGLVKMVEGSKNVSRALDGNHFILKVEAIYNIEESDYIGQIEKYVAAKNESANVVAYVKQLQKDENQLQELSKDASMSDVELEEQLREFKKSYKLLKGAIALNGSDLVSKYTNETIELFEEIKEYFVGLKGVDFSNMFEPKIINVETAGKNSNKVELTVTFKSNLNKKEYKKFYDLFEKYKDVLYKQNSMARINRFTRVIVTLPVFLISEDNDVLQVSYRGYLDMSLLYAMKSSHASLIEDHLYKMNGKNSITFSVDKELAKEIKSIKMTQGSGYITEAKYREVEGYPNYSFERKVIAKQFDYFQKLYSQPWGEIIEEYIAILDTAIAKEREAIQEEKDEFEFSF